MQLTWTKKNNQELEKNFKEACQNELFVKLIKKLKLTKEEAMKITSKLENSLQELENCNKCPGLGNCQNSYNGHISMAKKNNDKIFFTYLPCKYLQKREKEEKLKYRLKHELEEARMKDIDVTDKKRIKIIKWLDNFYDNFNYKDQPKGLYLYGNFGCGKTFLINALFNELKIMKKVNCLMIYFPELLRDLKNDWDSYEDRISYLENIDILCIDDIGAEKVSEWSRDEVLGTILQTRMNKGRTTSFTSNLSLEELESHFISSNNVEETLKSRRIMERIKQLTEPLELISANRRK